MVLRDGRQALIKKKLEAIMVSFDDESASPEVRPPVTNGENEADQLPFVGRQGAMSWRH